MIKNLTITKNSYHDEWYVRYLQNGRFRVSSFVDELEAYEFYNELGGNKNEQVD